MFEAILWDNDGVLVDTEGFYFQATREILAERGVGLSADDYRQLFLVESRGAWHLTGLPEGEELADCKRRRDQRYAALIDNDEVIVREAAAAIPRLAAHYRMAIVTSSHREHFERVHARGPFLPHFEFVLAAGDYLASKPHPAPYLTAVARLGVAPGRCLVIEDSERGLIAAKAAGLTCWILPSALTRPFSFASADRVLTGWDELWARLLPGAPTTPTAPP